MRPTKTIIGSNELVSIGKKIKDIPAKIDTGADSSSIWASKIKVKKDGTLVFALFGEGSPYYTGKVFKRSDYKVAVVRSATGEEQIRYRTHISIRIADRPVKVLFNLSDRSKNNFKVLIGRRTIANKFIVDVTKQVVRPSKNPQTKPLNRKLQKDPYKFYRKYVKTKVRKEP